MKITEIPDPLFREAVEAIDTGNLNTLEELITQHPQLVTERLPVPEKGYFQKPYLLWFIANNPIRNHIMAANIVAITGMLIRKIKQAGAGDLQQQLDYTLGLVATGSVPRESGRQPALIDLLIDEGAVPGNGIGALAHGNKEAAQQLINRGGRLTLVLAVCLDQNENVEALIKTAGPADLSLALVAASFYGKAAAVAFLIKHGADVNVFLDPASGFHSHATALHQAVFSGSLQTVQYLVEAGADLYARDKVYEGTASGWAEYMQTEAKDDTMREKYKAIESYLLSKM